MSDNLFRREVPVPTGTFSEPIFLPRRAQSVAVAVHPGAGGSAKAQVTLSAKDYVDQNPNGASVRWIDWDDGLVSAATVRGFSGLVTAVRASAVNADAVLEVVVGLDQ